jgi:hypothetical protein
MTPVVSSSVLNQCEYGLTKCVVLVGDLMTIPVEYRRSYSKAIWLWRWNYQCRKVRYCVLYFKSCILPLFFYQYCGHVWGSNLLWIWCTCKGGKLEISWWVPRLNWLYRLLWWVWQCLCFSYSYQWRGSRMIRGLCRDGNCVFHWWIYFCSRRYYSIFCS